MGYVFDQRAAQGMDAWYDSVRRAGYFQPADVSNLAPAQGQMGGTAPGRGLRVGAPPRSLQKRRAWTSPVWNLPRHHAQAGPETALGNRAGLFPGRAEDLPFEDNEFDIVTLITCLEFVENPEEALAEALRVAKPPDLRRSPEQLFPDRDWAAV